MELPEEFINKMRGSIDRFLKPILWHIFHRIKSSQNGHHADDSADREHCNPSGDDLF